MGRGVASFVQRSRRGRGDPAGPPTNASEDRVERRRKMKDILERIAESGAFAHITDPVAWQREIRKDRPLPGREDDE